MVPMPRPSRTLRSGPRPPHHLLAAAVACLLAAGAPAAAEPAPPTRVTPADLADRPAFSVPADELLALARAAEPGAPEADALGDAEVEILFRTSTLTFGADGASTLRRHEVYRILTSTGAETWNEVSMDYAPWHQARPDLRARVISPDGRTHTLDPETVSAVSLESDLPDVYMDRERVVAPLPAVEAGAVVETLVEVADEAPLFEAGTVHRELLAAVAPARLVRVTLDRPEGLAVGHRVALPAASPTESPAGREQPTVERRDGRIRQVFEARSTAPIGFRPAGLPREETHYPYVAFATGRSWAEVARAYHRVVDRQIAASDLGNVAIPGDNLPSQWEQIAARVAWMQRAVRYTGVNLGEAAIVPRPPARTLARRYGDCKDKATLLVAALRELGVPAYVALLRAGSPDDIDPDLPGLGAGGFDHAIVYVPGAPALWIDATDPYSTLGELPTIDQGRLALVASPNTEGLIRTPVADADDNRVAETREVFLPELGNGRVVETSVLRGAPARELRSFWDGATQEEIREGLAAYAETEYGTASATEVEHTAPDDLSGPLHNRFTVEEAAWVVTDLVQGFVAIPVPSLLQRMPYAAFREPDEEAERLSDFVVDEPHAIEWSYRIHVPEGFEARDLPEDETREMGPAVYSATFEERDREIRATFRLRLDARRIAPDELAALREGVTGLESDGNLLVWFDQTAARHMAAGRMGEAFAENRRLAALHPDEALHRVQLAQTALAAGLVEEARRQAEAAVELEPDRFLSHQVLGLTRLHGLAGRELGPGFDRAGAIAAFERARELDASKVETVVNLALLHEHDAAGRRYRDPDGMERAVALYREVQEDLEGTEHEINLPLALLWLGRAEEAYEVLDGDDGAPRLRSVRAAAAALAESPEAAIREVERASAGDGTTRSQVLTKAAQTLVAQRHYPEATVLMRAASESSDNPAQLQGMIRMIENLRPWQEIRPEDPDSPEDAFYRLVALATEEGPPDPEELRPLVSQAWRDVDREVLNELLAGGLAFAETAGRVAPGNAVDVIRDLFFGVGEPVATELPGVGWAIRMATDLPIPGKDEGMVVVREGGAYRFAAAEARPATLGHYALELVRRGDPEAARPWLDHAFGLTRAAPEWDTLPSAEALFHSLWEDGEDGPEPASPEVAAAALVADELPDEGVVEVLRAARQRAAEDPERRLLLDHALASALYTLEKDEALLAVAEPLAEEHDTEFYLRAALDGLGRHDALLELAERQIEEEPDGLSGHAWKAQILSDRGDLEGALAIYRDLVGHPDAHAGILNQAAWVAVALDAVDDEALEWARRAAEETDFADDVELHTLASTFAAAGRPEAAHKVLLQAIRARPSGSTIGADWYVFGRIAEEYGLTDAAREYYLRVEGFEGGDGHPLSTWTMARERLETLETR